MSKPPRFSSTVAFVALYDALRNVERRSEADEALFRALEGIVASLRPEERAALDSPPRGVTTTRRRERAIVSLERELRRRAMIEA